MIGHTVVSRVVKKIGGNYGSLKLLGGFSDSVYQVEVNDKPLVMKFYIASQINKSLIVGELNWINFLAKNGMRVAKPISTTTRKSFVEEIEVDKIIYYYVIFERVEGSFIQHENWNGGLIENWGGAMGKMHNLAKQYEVPNEGEIIKWDENDVIISPPTGASDAILAKWDYYIKRLKKLSTSNDSFGIIHNDLHHKNLYFKNGEPQLFDFGDCEYGWFIYDIAIPLYHAVQGISVNQVEKLAFAKGFLQSFMKGYSRENKLDCSWLQEISFFLDFRRLYSYLYILKNIKSDQINMKLERILNEMKNQIENDIPYIKGL